MKLKPVYAKKEDIPAGAEQFYTEQSDGSWKISLEGDIKTQEDVDRVKQALTSERDLRVEKEKELAKFKDVDLEKWNKIKDLDPEDSSAGSGDDVRKKLAEEYREKERRLQETYQVKETELKSKVDEAEKRAKTYVEDSWKRKMLAEKFGFTEPRRLNALILEIKHGSDPELNDARKLFNSVEAREENGNYRVVGSDLGDEKGAFEALERLAKLDVAKHYRPATDNVGGGANNQGNQSGSGQNPYKKETWNVTEQGRLEKANITEAKRLASQAGIKIGE